MNYNSYGVPNYGVQPKSPQQLMDEYANTMAQYQAMMSGQAKQPPIMPQNTSVSERGQFVKVASFEEVKDYPTSLDGTATLFFDFEHRVFWSKKFLNGSHAIQAFKFEPINSAETSTAKEEEVDYTKELEAIPDPTTERLDKLEKMIESLIVKKSPTKTKKAEEVKNEI